MAKSNLPVMRLCANESCSNEFDVRLSRNQHKRCCSPACSGVVKTKGPTYTVCVFCNASLKNRFNRFCNQTCSAKHNNQNRPPRTAESKAKTSSAILGKQLKVRFKSSPVIFIECHHCTKLFCSHGRGMSLKTKCRDCQLSFKRGYKSACQFMLNKRDHAELFDSELISKYGWFVSAGIKKNTNGVTWDHLYPLHLGFARNVDPDIISHPANAELVPWYENMRRYREDKAMITYEELLNRIQQWDSGNRNLPRFYQK